MNWEDDKYSVGVPLIDQQHKELFSTASQLFQAMEGGVGRAVTADMLAFLERYVIDHFAAEEELMARHAISSRAAHVSQHREFIDALKGARAQLSRTGPGPSLAIRLNFLLSHWLCDHIGTADKTLGRQLASRGEGLGTVEAGPVSLGARHPAVPAAAPPPGTGERSSR